MSTKKEREFDRLKDEFDQIQDGFDDDSLFAANEMDNIEDEISNHLATSLDLPDLGQIELYDYESDLTVSTEKSMDLIESLVKLYLGEFGDLSSHPYIKNKIKEDASVYAETLFLSKMTRKNFLTQMRQVDNGDNSARMHEVINQTIREIRENSRFASTQRNELEKYYKEFRQDLNDVGTNNITKSESGGNPSGDIVSNSELNDLINQALKNKRTQ